MQRVRGDGGGRGIPAGRGERNLKGTAAGVCGYCGCGEPDDGGSNPPDAVSGVLERVKGNKKGNKRWRLPAGLTEAELLSGYASTALLALLTALSISRVLGWWGAP